MTTQAQWIGTEAESVLFNALVRLGKKLGTDFQFQPGFGFLVMPNLLISIRLTVDPNRGRANILKAQMAGEGVDLIFIDEERLYSDPQYVVEAALSHRDLSFRR